METQGRSYKNNFSSVEMPTSKTERQTGSRHKHTHTGCQITTKGQRRMHETNNKEIQAGRQARGEKRQVGERKKEKTLKDIRKDRQVYR